MIDGARLILGFLYFAFGLNGFFHFRPLPKMNPEMEKFSEALVNTKIILPVVKGFEVTFGLALLLNQWTLLATVALLPISFFIVVAHLRFNRPQGYGMAALVGICTLLLVSDHILSLHILLQP